MPRPTFPAYPLTINQACRITGLSREILQAAIDSGTLPTRAFLEKGREITSQDLADWFNANATVQDEASQESRGRS
jgi:hypothetical protein